jgi:hypothetical protein
MVKLIMGLKGSGKTKQLIELVHKAVEEESGDVAFIEKGAKLTYDIPHKVRLIESTPYGFDGYDFFKGFISGLHSGNYDITHIFIDSALKIIGAEPDERIGDFLEWCEKFGKRENVKFTITVSADLSLATEKMKKYL